MKSTLISITFTASSSIVLPTRFATVCPRKTADVGAQVASGLLIPSEIALPSGLISPRIPAESPGRERHFRPVLGSLSALIRRFPMPPCARLPEIEKRWIVGARNCGAHWGLRHLRCD